MSTEYQLKMVPDVDVIMTPEQQRNIIGVEGDSDVYALCKRMTEIEKEMEEIHAKIAGLVEELNNTVKDKRNRHGREC